MDLIIERRTFSDDSIEFRAASDDSEARIKGHAAVFNSLSEVMFGFREQIAPGAFDKVMDDDVRVLFNHDSSALLGRTKAGTAAIGLDKNGLAYSVDVPDTQVGRDLVVSVERGDVTQSSFGFTIARKGDDWDEDENGVLIRTITKVGRLFDVSPVTFPAYTQTDVSKRSIENFYASLTEAHKVSKDKVIKAFQRRQNTFELMHRI